LKKLLLPLVLLAALVMPAQAAAVKTWWYEGTVGPSATRLVLGVVSFGGKHHKKKLLEDQLYFYAPVTCEDGAHTAYAASFDSHRLKKGRFNINVVGHTGATLQVHGGVGRTAASGTLSVSGDVPIVDLPPTATGLATGTNCASGLLNWTAARIRGTPGPINP
jgi:hypothetical protein